MTRDSSWLTTVMLCEILYTANLIIDRVDMSSEISTIVSTDSTPEPFVIGPEEGDAYWMLGTLTIIKATGEETDGSFSLSEQLAPAGFSPPKHVHPGDDELFYVLSGRVTFEIGDERITVTPGSTVYAPHGVPHSYVTEEETRSLIQVFKPGFEQFFAAVGRPAESWTIPTEGPTEEEMAKASEIAGQYGFEIIGPPLNAER